MGTWLESLTRISKKKAYGFECLPACKWWIQWWLFCGLKRLKPSTTRKCSLRTLTPTSGLFFTPYLYKYTLNATCTQSLSFTKIYINKKADYSLVIIQQSFTRGILYIISLLIGDKENLLQKIKSAYFTFKWYCCVCAVQIKHVSFVLLQFIIIDTQRHKKLHLLPAFCWRSTALGFSLSQWKEDGFKLSASVTQRDQQRYIIVLDQLQRHVHTPTCLCTPARTPTHTHTVRSYLSETAESSLPLL